MEYERLFQAISNPIPGTIRLPDTNRDTTMMVGMDHGYEEDEYIGQVHIENWIGRAAAFYPTDDEHSRAGQGWGWCLALARARGEELMLHDTALWWAVESHRVRLPA